jgi:endonuclease III
MIDAANITDYNLFDNELEARMIFWVLAAGKNGTRAAEITNKMVDNWIRLVGNIRPFKVLRSMDMPELVKMCAFYGTGCQTSKGRSLYELSRANLNLRTCLPEDLEKIYGIGMKTARCFIIHSRENAPFAGLDTHILKHLRELGYDAPKNTPSSKKKYLTLEKIVLTLAEKTGKSPADYDLMIWNQYKVGGNKSAKEVNV